MFDRGKSDALFTKTLDLLDMLNTRDGRFEYADYVTLHNNITALYDSFAEVDELQEFAKAQVEGRLVVLPCTDNQTVYAIVQGILVVEVFITEVSISYTNKDGIKFLGIQDDVDDFEFDLSDFGKTVFLTREAAEKALGGGEE